MALPPSSTKATLMVISTSDSFGDLPQINFAQLPLHPAHLLSQLSSRAGPAAACLHGEQVAFQSSELPPVFLHSRAVTQVLASHPYSLPPSPGCHTCQQDGENWINTWELLFAQLLYNFWFYVSIPYLSTKTSSLRTEAVLCFFLFLVLFKTAHGFSRQAQWPWKS